MKSSFDPQQSRLLDVQEPVQSVSRERLHVQGLRQHFRAPPHWQPEIAFERRLPMTQNAVAVPASIAAAVLIPLVVYPENVQVLLTRRTDHLHDHPGQISFPGGRVELGDAHVEATALRETQEEIGLLPAQIELLGRLPNYHTATGYCVTPVIGLVAPPLTVQRDAFEVAEVFEVPFDFLMNGRNHQWREFSDGRRLRQFYAMPYQDQQHKEYFIWGATAGMLRNLYRFLLA